MASVEGHLQKSGTEVLRNHQGHQNQTELWRLTQPEKTRCPDAMQYSGGDPGIENALQEKLRKFEQNV